MNVIEIFKALLFGLVEGLTEWLPISSTGHMILIDEFIRLDASDAFKEMFMVVIQLGAIMAVVCLYFDKLNPFSSDKTREERKGCIDLWGKVIAGCLPAAVFGFLFDDWLDKHLYNYATVSLTLILYGVLYIVIESRGGDSEPKIDSPEDFTYKEALIIGLFQVLALVPGTSRSGVTILGGIMLGASRFAAAEYSFFLAIPVMFGASALKLVKFGFTFTLSEIVILAVGMISAFLVSIVAIRFLLAYIKRRNFKKFGYYRIALGLCVMLYFILN